MSEKILIVDDDTDMRLILRAALAPIGGLLEAANGRDALRLIRAEKPRLVLLDVVMPEMDGIETLAAARRIDPNIIVVMLTGQSDISMAKKALDAGARAYVTKPFDEVYLRAEVRRLLEGDEARDPEDASGRPWRVRPS
jgi:DNA-binding NtrC family response regulator